jgi:hypothetical protein
MYKQTFFDCQGKVRNLKFGRKKNLKKLLAEAEMVSFLAHNIYSCCRRPDLEQRFDYNRRQSGKDCKQRSLSGYCHQASRPISSVRCSALHIASSQQQSSRLLVFCNRARATNVIDRSTHFVGLLVTSIRSVERFSLSANQ